MKKSLLVGILVIVFVITLVPSSNSVLDEQESILEVTIDHQIELSDSYILHTPITINNNSDLSSQGWPGSGTVEDPFVIQGLNITAEEDCMVIKNTTLYLEVKNCFISSNISDIWGDASYGGIRIENAMQITIQDCIIQRHERGMFAADSASINLIRNTISGNEVGVRFDDSYNCSFTHNIVNDGNAGFWFWVGDNFTFTNNIAANNRYDGFHLSEIGNCTFTNNLAANNSEEGFQLSHAGEGIFTYNIAVNNSNVGFALADSDNCTITNNTITQNGIGFSLYYSDDCYIVDNNSTENSSGFSINYCNSCTIVNNTITDNWRYGINVCGKWNMIYLNRIGRNGIANAMDNSEYNSWDDGISRGNYWRDYDGIGPYQISGFGGDFDYYPFVWEEVIAIENLERLLILACAFSITIVTGVEGVIRNRKISV